VRLVAKTRVDARSGFDHTCREPQHVAQPIEIFEDGRLHHTAGRDVADVRAFRATTDRSCHVESRRAGVFARDRPVAQDAGLRFPAFHEIVEAPHGLFASARVETAEPTTKSSR
jgi:hypothetical protein